MALLPWPQTPLSLAVVVVVGAPVIGILWSPAIALLSDRADELGVEQAVVFALLNLAWSAGQTGGDAGSARLAQATSDAVPYLILAAVCAVTFVRLRSARPGRGRRSRRCRPTGPRRPRPAPPRPRPSRRPPRARPGRRRRRPGAGAATGRASGCRPPAAPRRAPPPTPSARCRRPARRSPP